MDVEPDLVDILLQDEEKIQHDLNHKQQEWKESDDLSQLMLEYARVYILHFMEQLNVRVSKVHHQSDDQDPQQNQDRDDHRHQINDEQV